MHEQAAAVDVPQEVVAQARAVAGALNDARDVGQDKTPPLADIDDSQVGEEGSEVVVGYLGVSVGHHAEQRALAHIGGNRPGPRRPGA